MPKVIEREVVGVSNLIVASIESDAPVETVWSTVHDPAVYVEGIDWVRAAWWEDGRTRYMQRIHIRALS